MSEDQDKVLAIFILDRRNVAFALWKNVEAEGDLQVLQELRKVVKAARAEAVSPFSYVGEQYTYLCEAIAKDVISSEIIEAGNFAWARIHTAIRSHILNRWPELKAEMT